MAHPHTLISHVQTAAEAVSLVLDDYSRSSLVSLSNMVFKVRMLAPHLTHSDETLRDLIIMEASLRGMAVAMDRDPGGQS